MLQVLFGVSGFQELVERFFDYLLKPLQNGLGAGVVIIFLTHALWFFGIHGHNMLDTVIKQNFSDITAGIFSKTMQDVFVLLGGVGAVLCLVIASIEKLDDNAYYIAYASLEKLTSYAHFYNWAKNREMDANLWCAVYTSDEDGYKIGRAHV